MPARDAIELNIYDVVVDPHDRRRPTVEQRYIDLDRGRARRGHGAARGEARARGSPRSPHFATALEAAGVDGLVLFNRFYQPDIDLDTLDVTPRLELSTSADARLPLHWIGILRGLRVVLARRIERCPRRRRCTEAAPGRRRRGDDDERAPSPRPTPHRDDARLDR